MAPIIGTGHYCYAAVWPVVFVCIFSVRQTHQNVSPVRHIPTGCSSFLVFRSLKSNLCPALVFPTQALLPSILSYKSPSNVHYIEIERLRSPKKKVQTIAAYFCWMSDVCMCVQNQQQQSFHINLYHALQWQLCKSLSFSTAIPIYGNAV